MNPKWSMVQEHGKVITSIISDVQGSLNDAKFRGSFETDEMMAKKHTPEYFEKIEEKLKLTLDLIKDLKERLK